MQNVFSLVGLTVMPFWALMIFLPRWRWTRRIVQSPWLAIGPALVYAVLVVPELATILPAVARPELASIASLLGSESGATISWSHFLAFDLLIGRWAYLDSQERGVPAVATSICLLFILLIGPIGWFSYMVVRTLMAARQPKLQEAH